MSAQAFVSVAIAFDEGHSAAVEALLDALGNPAAAAVSARLQDSEFVHFMSLTVVRGDAGRRAHLVLEASADGSPRAALARIAQVLSGELRALLEAAGVPVSAAKLGATLEAHRLDLGPGWFGTLGVVFSGSPGMTVARIRFEARLAARIQDMLERDRPRGAALAILERVRAVIFEDVDLKRAFLAEPVPLLGQEPRGIDIISPLLISALRNFLWPLLVLPALMLFVSPFAAFLALAAEVLLLIVGLGLAWLSLRREENADDPDDADPCAQEVAEIMRLENQTAQNHLAGVSTMKPGRVRRLALHVVLWIVGEFAGLRARPGFLSGIGTIHFARWVLLPGTDKLLFFSNYAGSWESYLEDFIVRAHAGLTGVWSNTLDFPKTRSVFLEGATDGDRFKRWARRQQRPTRFWYTAYPTLTTERIRINAAIRHGFAGAFSEGDAVAWLANFSFAPVPGKEVETAQVPILVFGGLRRFEFSRCLALRLSDAPADCRAWLAAIAPHVSYGERLPERAALVTAFTATGLGKLGLDAASLATFPTAFQHGMAASWRARALGDSGDDAPECWRWGGPGNAADALLILYTASDETLQEQTEILRRQVADFRHGVVQEILLKRMPPRGQPLREPFGFTDGVSQPLIRGLRSSGLQRNEIHVVEPGEMILGYPDNSGYFAPPPALGRNGSFLVVRQLEQDEQGFQSCLAEAAAKLEGDERVPRRDPAWLSEWLAAKMVGRWRDGTSLVRHPREPGTAGGRPLPPDNDFLFGTEDPHGLRCPFGAHIRRANPRESLDPGTLEQLAISNRHRILRVGRRYEPQNGLQNPGLMFMCVNADIEGQFEFLQQTWILGASFHGLEDEVDPIVGKRGASDVFTIPTAHGPLRLRGMRDFITVRGGGYFFMPGRGAIESLVAR